ncbi:MAG: NAD(P)/FAD-dependent oxidoreductase [Cyanobacteriota bacterium]|nr:NAD(P)/FAD-dependent oxidoreductase [Cyanobacteriota bacterium]
MSSPSLRVAVVGAGSAGLLLAALLHRQGHRVRVFEKADRLRAEGCGILLVRSGVEAIAASGLEGLLERFLAQGLAVSRFVVRNLRGDLIDSSPAEQVAGELPSLLLHRRVILEALASALPPEIIQFNAEVLRWRQNDPDLDPAPVEAVFRQGDLWRGDLLVGADGLFSRVAPLVAPERQLNYLGDRVWRGVVADASFCREGEFFVYARGRGVYANVFDLGATASEEALTHWGVFQEEPLPAEREEQRRLLEEPVPEEALAKVPADLAALIRSTPADAVVANWSFDINPLPRLHQGRVVLIGDAAHAMSSSQARGMTAGLEDAVALARLLDPRALVASSAAAPPPVDRALSAWERERLPVVHAYQERSRAVSARTGRRRPPRVRGAGAAPGAPPGAAPGALPPTARPPA